MPSETLSEPIYFLCSENRLMPSIFLLFICMCLYIYVCTLLLVLYVALFFGSALAKMLLSTIALAVASPVKK